LQELEQRWKMLLRNKAVPGTSISIRASLEAMVSTAMFTPILRLCTDVWLDFPVEEQFRTFVEDRSPVAVSWRDTRVTSIFEA